MKNQIATTKEQSQRLIACGVNPDSADMIWQAPITVSQKQKGGLFLIVRNSEKEIYNHDTPAWSLSALLALLPKEITDDNGDSYYLSIAQEFPLSYEYGISYKPCWSDGDAIMRERDNCPIEACVKAVEWLLKNGYKLNKS